MVANESEALRWVVCSC